MYNYDSRIHVLLFLGSVNLKIITNIIFRSNIGSGSEYVNPIAVPAIGITWGGGKGANAPPPYFFKLGVVYLVTEFNNGKSKIDRKKENDKLACYGTNFPLFQN
jgi:hypothetical protein